MKFMLGVMQRYVDVCRGMQRCAEVHRDAQRYAGVCRHMHRCAEVYRGVCRGAWKYVEVYRGAWRYAEVAEVHRSVQRVLLGA